MSAELVIRNCQRTHRINLPFLRQVVRHLLETELRVQAYELGIELVGKRRMAVTNWRYLRHEGPTDIITFPPSETTAAKASTVAEHSALQGDLVLCIPVAEEQAREYRTIWQEEVVRYIIHGILHLQGFDDLEPAARRVLKRREDRLVRRLARRFTLSKLG